MSVGSMSGSHLSSASTLRLISLSVFICFSRVGAVSTAPDDAKRGWGSGRKTRAADVLPALTVVRFEGKPDLMHSQLNVGWPDRVGTGSARLHGGGRTPASSGRSPVAATHIREPSAGARDCGFRDCRSPRA